MPFLSGAGGRFVTPAELLGAKRIIVPANGLEFEVFEAGEGDRLALLLHGFPQHAIEWRHLVSPLVEAGYRVWAVNQRGYGETSRPAGKEAYSLDALTGDVAALIDASKARSVALIGHDWGGFIAWIVAIRRMRPIERLIAVNIPHPLCYHAALRTWEQRRRSWYVAFFQLPWLPDWLLSRRRGAAVAKIMRQATPHHPMPREAIEIYRNNVAAPGAATAMLNWYRAAAPDIVRAKGLAAPVQTPTLMIWGTDDIALSEACFDGTERFVRNLRIERLRGITHFSPEDAPDQVTELVCRFL